MLHPGAQQGGAAARLPHQHIAAGGQNVPHHRRSARVIIDMEDPHRPRFHPSRLHEQPRLPPCLAATARAGAQAVAAAWPGPLMVVS